MTGILSSVGHDLAALVHEQGLPTTDLNVRSPIVRCKRPHREMNLLDYILLYLIPPRNSMWFVGDNLDYLNAYVNALALLMARPDDLRKEMKRIYDQYQIEGEQGFSEQVMYARVGKRLHTVDTLKLVTLGESIADWDRIMPALYEEAAEKDYFLVMYHMHRLFNKQNTQYHYLARHFFFATRFDIKLSFIAPMLWEDYGVHIEHGELGNLIQHRRPIYFSPRPQHLPKHSLWDYDPDYVF